MDFQEFPKMARLSRECVITEKIDGTNAQILIGDDGSIVAGSRSRWITPDDDNHGFAAWVADNADELRLLGPGRHFGEWWGLGIQRKYNQTEKRFSLFNTLRWCAHDAEPVLIPSADPRAEPKYQTRVPACVGVVPVLYRGLFDTNGVDAAITRLCIAGSAAAPGFMRPEGVVVFHIAGRVGFKKTLEKDEVPKALHKPPTTA